MVVGGIETTTEKAGFTLKSRTLPGAGEGALDPGSSQHGTFLEQQHFGALGGQPLGSDSPSADTYMK